MKSVLLKIAASLLQIRRIEVRSWGGKWCARYAFRGIYRINGFLWDYPLRLVHDGSGIVLRKDMALFGKPYPGFEWRYAA